MRCLRELLAALAAVIVASCGDDGPVRPRHDEDDFEVRAPAYESLRVRWDPAERAAAVAAGSAALVRLGCLRCHVIDDLASGSGTSDAPSSAAAIDLTLIARRVRTDFIADYLRAPFDLRPGLTNVMPAEPLSDQDIRAIVSYFAAIAEVAATELPAASGRPGVSLERASSGRALFEARGCPSCHAMGERRVEVVSPLAPDLRHVARRMHPDVIVDLIVDPQRVNARASMPNLRVSIEEAERIRDYLLSTQSP